MSLRWREFWDDLYGDLYTIYLGAVASWGEWYVHPLGERAEDINPGRRCFTHWGARRMRLEFDRAEAAAVEPEEIDRWETQDSVMVIHSYPVDTVWVVSRWQDPPSPEVAETGKMLQNAITRDLFFPSAP